LAIEADRVLKAVERPVQISELYEGTCFPGTVSDSGPDLQCLVISLLGRLVVAGLLENPADLLKGGGNHRRFAEPLERLAGLLVSGESVGMAALKHAHCAELIGDADAKAAERMASVALSQRADGSLGALEKRPCRLDRTGVTAGVAQTLDLGRLGLEAGMAPLA
jgi:hypothetical protein